MSLMRFPSPIFGGAFALAFALTLTSPAAGSAQGVTTAAISGTVTTEQGRGLEAANVTVVNNANGTRYATQSRADGRYFVQNLEIGGPYTVSVRRIGYAPADSGN